MANEQDLGHELGWDDTIEKDGGEFLLLPEGDYDFRVDHFERGRHAGSEKLPPCNKAVVTIEITGKEGTIKLDHTIFLHSKTEGMLSAFFAAIGQKKKGEKLQMNWSLVPGATGRCKLGIRNWKSKSGDDMQSNEIKRFYVKEDAPAFETGRF